MIPKYTRDQWLTILAATIFLIGAVFMLVNVFAAQTWALAVGLGLAIVASLIMLLAMIDNKKRVKANMKDTTNANDVESIEKSSAQKRS